jgi:hypothetical protein
VKGGTAFAQLKTYDYITGAMKDIVHTLKEIVKKVLNVCKGNRLVKDGKTHEEKLIVAETRARANCLKRTPAQQRRADRKYVTLPLPPGSIRRGVRPFAQTGSLTINDLHRYLQPSGPGSYHLAASDLDDEALTVIIELMACIDVLVAPEIDVEAMGRKRTAWLEALARAERLLPHPEAQALINHHLVEIWDQVLEFGPAWSYWTYIFERFLSRLVRKITNRAGINLL